MNILINKRPNKVNMDNFLIGKFSEKENFLETIPAKWTQIRIRNEKWMKTKINNNNVIKLMNIHALKCDFFPSFSPSSSSSFWKWKIIMIMNHSTIIDWFRGNKQRKSENRKIPIYFFIFILVKCFLNQVNFEINFILAILVDQIWLLILFVCFFLPI